jgi:prepilin-type N-terminal cleavage/methylation domain-containing protein
MQRKNQKGFTLMELMVVIVIVAILAAVAVPLYINYVRDAQRTEAKGAVGAVVTAEQTYYQQFNKYTADTFVKDPSGTNAGKQVLNCDLTEALNNWDISVAIGSTETDGFIVTATGKTSNQNTNGLEVVYTYSRSNPPSDPWAGTK